MMARRPKNSRGFALPATIAVAMMVVLFGTFLAVYLQDEGKSSIGGYYHGKAADISYVGYEQALEFLNEDTDWSDDGGTLFNAIAALGGFYTVTLSNASTDTITVESVGTFQDADYRVTKTVNRGQSDALFLIVDTSEYFLADIGKSLGNIKLINIHPTKDIPVIKQIVAWVPDGGEKIGTISYDVETVVWDGAGIGSPANGPEFTGVLIDIVDQVVDQGDQRTVTFNFDASVIGTHMSLFFILEDGSTAFGELDVLDKDIFYFELDLFEAELGEPNAKFLQNVIFRNTHATRNITLVTFTLFWEPNSTDEWLTQFKSVQSGGETIIWNGVAFSGDVVDVDDFSIAPGEEIHFRFKFNDNAIMVNKIWQLGIVLSDGTSGIYPFDFRVFQGDLLIVDTVTAVVVGVGENVLDLIGLGNEDNFAPITITKMRVNLDPDGGQEITKIDIGAVTVFSGSPNGDLGSLLNITDYELDPAAVGVPLTIEFNADVLPATFNLEFEMGDGSLRVVDPFFLDSTSTFTSDGRFVNIQEYNSTDTLQGYRIGNASLTDDLIITDMRVSWTPDSSETLSSIAVSGLTVFSGAASSGTLVDISDSTLLSGAGFETLSMVFSSDIVDKDFEIEFTFDDASTKTKVLKLDPANFIAGDNFESGDFGGGTGFLEGFWNTVGASDLISAADVYSGGQSLRLKKNSGLVHRGVDLFPYNNPKIRFVAKVDFPGIDPIEEAYFKVSSDGGGSYTIVNTWSYTGGGGIDTGENGYYYFEFSLKDYEPLTSTFRIAFESNMKTGNDKFYVDDIMIFE